MEYKTKDFHEITGVEVDIELCKDDLARLLNGFNVNNRGLEFPGKIRISISMKEKDE